MYTTETLENLNIELSELEYSLKEICYDSRVKFSNEERYKIRNLKKMVENSKAMVKDMLHKRQAKMKFNY